jgi:ABC-type branched-subunit amino acid transport system permease subunit
MKRALARSPWPALVFFLAVAGIGPLLDSFWLSLLTLVFFYALMGLSWNLMMSAGLLSLGHALFLGLGAYATAILTASGGITPWVAIPAGAGVAALTGSMIGWVGGRFSVRGVQFAVLTIAFAELVRVLFDNWEFVGSQGDQSGHQSTIADAPRWPAVFIFRISRGHRGSLFSGPALDGLPVGFSLARDQ